MADTHLRTGNADKEIVRLSEEIGAGMIVIGSRGLGAVGRILMGSVSDSVVRHAHVPVFVVRRDAAHETPTAGRTVPVEERREAGGV